MRPDDVDGLPLIASTASGLGVRRNTDIPVVDGLVWPCTGGMSVVADDPRRLPGHRKPPSLDGTAKGHVVFMIDDESISGPLVARRDQPVELPFHRAVEPAVAMTFEAYESAIHATRAKWSAYDAT
jgi:hypothetical protein